MKKYRIHIPASAVSDRLDRLIVQHHSGFSRREIKRLIDRGSVYVNGRRIRQASYQVFPPAEIQIFVKENLEIEHVAVQIHWHSLVLYQDAHLLIINKPPGIPTAPTVDSAVHNVYAYLQQAGILSHPFYPFHRLDLDTSGVLMIPLSRQAVRKLNEQMRHHRIQKIYLALCQGIPASTQWETIGTISRQRQPPSRYRFSPQPGMRGFYSESHFRCLAYRSQPEVSLIQARPVTGRTHQIRLHLQHAGLPILGDAHYGFQLSGWPGDFPSPERTLLHCREMMFTHPLTLDRISVQAPLPADFARFLRLLFPDISDKYITNAMPTL